MELRQLGKSGLRVSALSLGAMTFGESTTFMKGVTSPDEEARRVSDASIDAGMNLVDTAKAAGVDTAPKSSGGAKPVEEGTARPITSGDLMKMFKHHAKEEA